ncbi:hypothetical protein Y027_5737 [Burkholderia pseudomallei TSV5]|nr:hypothetical protein Y027_5737 [Burkholderia pseudomallei TSV5]
MRRRAAAGAGRRERRVGDAARDGAAQARRNRDWVGERSDRARSARLASWRKGRRTSSVFCRHESKRGPPAGADPFVAETRLLGRAACPPTPRNAIGRTTKLDESPRAPLARCPCRRPEHETGTAD